MEGGGWKNFRYYSDLWPSKGPQHINRYTVYLWYCSFHGGGGGGGKQACPHHGIVLNNGKERTSDIDGSQGHDTQWKRLHTEWFSLHNILEIMKVQKQRTTVVATGKGKEIEGGYEEVACKAKRKWKIRGWILPVENKGRDFLPLPFLRTNCFKSLWVLSVFLKYI